MTPADRPVGWVLVDAAGEPVRARDGTATLYLGMRTAENAATRRNSSAIPTPVWSREAWTRHMATLDSAAS